MRKRIRWLQAIIVGAVATAAVGLACERWALACRPVDLDDTSNSADVAWVDRDAFLPSSFHPSLDALAAPLDVAMPFLSLVAAFRLPIPNVSNHRQTAMHFHTPRAPPARVWA